MINKTGPEIVIVGSANMDYLIQGPNLPRPGETVMGSFFQEAPGGKGANQAVAVSRLGVHAALVAKVGYDTRGKSILKQLTYEGINTKFVTKDPNEISGVALIMVGERGEKEILTAPGANLNLSTQQIHNSADLIKSSRVLMTQLGKPLEAILHAVRLAYQAGAKVVLDPSPATALPDELMQMVSIIKPNSTEAESLTGIRVIDRSSAKSAAKLLLERGVNAVSLQAGLEGNLIVTPENEYWFPLLPVESIDATGAGDAFAAALAVTLLENRPWREVGAWASAAAALTTTKIGAQAALPTREQVLSLLLEQGFRE